MDKAYLRHSNGTFDITFHLASSEFKVNRRFNFTRKLEEPISSFLSRINANVEKVVNKKIKKKKTDTQLENTEYKVSACLLQNNTVIDDDTLCGNVFQEDGNDTILKVLDKNYLVVINAPYINAITLPNSILANFPVYPGKFEAVYTIKELCEFVWFVSKNKETWRKVGTGFMYSPINTDINCYLKLMCTPKNEKTEGPIVEIIADVAVDASPGECPFEHRHMFTREKCNNSK